MVTVPKLQRGSSASILRVLKESRVFFAGQAYGVGSRRAFASVQPENKNLNLHTLERKICIHK